MEIHGDSPEIVEHWMGILDEFGDAPAPAEDDSAVEGQPPIAADMPHTRRRRRRRRRGRRGGGGHA